MERKRRISAPFLRAGLNNYQQSKTAVQPENTIIAFIQAEIADNIFSPDRKSTRLNSSHRSLSRMPSSA